MRLNQTLSVAAAIVAVFIAACASRPDNAWVAEGEPVAVTPAASSVSAGPAPAGGCCVQQLVTGSCLTFSRSGRSCSGNGGQLPAPNACKDAPSIVQCQSPDLDAACNGKKDGDACTYQVQNFYSYDGACAGHYMCP